MGTSEFLTKISLTSVLMTFAPFFQQEFIPFISHPATLVKTKNHSNLIGGLSAQDVDRHELIAFTAQKLAAAGLAKLPAKKFEYSKLNRANQTPANDMSKVYRIRTAAMLIRLAADGKIYGAKQMCKKFNRKKNCGAATSKIYKASPGLIRFSLISLEKLGFLKKTDNTSSKRGRVITKSGKSFVDKSAVEMLKSKLI